MASFDVKIPVAREVGSGGYTPYTVYDIRVAGGGIRGKVSRRYREFAALAKALPPGKPRLALPSKVNVLGVDTESRRKALESALQSYCGAFDKAESMPKPLLQFLALRRSRSLASKSGSGLGRGTAPSAAQLEALTAYLVARAVADKRAPATTAALQAALKTRFGQLTGVLALVALLLGGSRPRLKWACIGAIGALLATGRVALIAAKGYDREREKEASEAKEIAASAGAKLGDAEALQGSDSEVTSRWIQRCEDSPGSSKMVSAPAAQPALKERPTIFDPTAKQTMPEAVVVRVKESAKKFAVNSNVEEACSCDGTLWEEKKDEGGVKIWACTVPGQRFLRWRARFIINFEGTVDDIKTHLFYWPYRLRWDQTFKEGEVLATYRGAEPGSMGEMTLYASRALARAPSFSCSARARVGWLTQPLYSWDRRVSYLRAISSTFAYSKIRLTVAS